MSDPFDFSPQRSLLADCLAAAVPLWVHELTQIRRALDDAAAFGRELQTRAARCSRVVAEHGDALMFRVKGTSAPAFNALAEGVACLSFCPGGVRVFGTRYEMISSGVLRSTSERDDDPPEKPPALVLPDPEFFGPCDAGDF